MLTFSQEDCDKHKRFGELIRQCVDWNVKTDQLIEIYELMTWYTSLGKTLEAHILEVISIKKPTAKKGRKR